MYSLRAIGNGVYIMTLLLLFSFFVSTLGQAQVNYVQNPSFEQYTKCPDDFDEINYATHWSGVDSNRNQFCTPEFCHTCTSDKAVSVPHNFRFNHYPRTGNGMAQVYMYSAEYYPNYGYKRDYLVGRFYKPLIAGKDYCISFFVLYEPFSEYAIQNIGAVINGGIVDTSQNCGQPKTSYTPQILSAIILRDTLNWMKIEGNFKAVGNEKYITIGNFFDKTHTNYVVQDFWGDTTHLSWYLVDDVSVVESDAPAFAGHDTTIAYGDSVFIGRNEILPDVRWYWDTAYSNKWKLIDTLHAGFWVKPSKGSNRYVVEQILCDQLHRDTVLINAWPLNIVEPGRPKEWNIYPNPARSEINVANADNPADAAMAIFDLSGRLITQQKLDFSHGTARLQLNLLPGVYAAHFQSRTGKEYIERLIIY